MVKMKAYKKYRIKACQAQGYYSRNRGTFGGILFATIYDTEDEARDEIEDENSEMENLKESKFGFIIEKFYTYE
jgi:hypothetical protein